MSTNISKQKREDLLNKIKEIRNYIAASQQDENMGNLLSYLSDLEKDVNGKKYGLVFEEHREEINEVLDTHTPVLTEEKDLFIDNGGQMNFLIEGGPSCFAKIAGSGDTLKATVTLRKRLYLSTFLADIISHSFIHKIKFNCHFLLL